MVHRDSALQVGEAAITEISRLHQGIIAHARASLTDAIRIGEILFQVREVLKNTNWISWMVENLPFNEKTGRRYVSCYERREQLALDNVSNLSEAYALIAANNGTKEHTPQQLHESTFFSDSIRLTQKLKGHINHELKDHPIDSWRRENWITLAAAIEPLAELYAKLKSLIG